jgi:tripartite-type tricarboxylate transporter receptor subunit TctC
MRSLFRLNLTAIALFAATSAALAQQYPNRPLRLIVPYPAGGATDVVARLVTERMSEGLGQQVFIENRPGAGTMIGASAVARGPADGYTMLMGDTATYALNPTLYDKQLTYDPGKDFTPVCRTGRVPLILVANPKTVSANTVNELIELARKEPGKIDFGAPGPGSPIHLAMELFKQRLRIQLTAISYKGGADALNDLLGGRIGLMMIDAATGVPHIKSGALKALGAGTDKRISAADDVPTIAEAGVPGYVADNWWGIMAPAGTPQPIVDRLYRDIQEVLKSPELTAAFAREGAAAVTMSTEEFTHYIEREIAKWARVVKEGNIRAQ